MLVGMKTEMLIFIVKKVQSTVEYASQFDLSFSPKPDAEFSQ